MEINIREPKPNEWKSLQELNNQVFENDKDHDKDLITNWAFTKTGTQYYKDLAKGKCGKCFVAIKKNKVVGYIATEEKDFDYRKGKYLEIGNIGVDTHYRSQGIGTMLINKIENWAKEEEYTKLFVSAFWGNNGAINFYEKSGFTKISVDLEKTL